METARRSSEGAREEGRRAFIEEEEEQGEETRRVYVTEEEETRRVYVTEEEETRRVHVDEEEETRRLHVTEEEQSSIENRASTLVGLINWWSRGSWVLISSNQSPRCHVLLVESG